MSATIAANDVDLASEVRAFIAENWDDQLTVREWWKRLADSGWGFPTWPTDWHGRGLSGDNAATVRHELRAAGVLPPPHGIGQTMGAPVILQFGTEEQKRRFMPKLASGEEAWCQFFSEPDAGSDLASLSTRAVRDGEEWVVNGQKVWNSGTLTSERGVLPLRTNPDVPKHRGISFFIIDVQQPGIDIRPIKQMNGEAHFNETFFTDARVRHEDLIGEENNGWAVTLATLANERTAYAAGAEYGSGATPGEQGGMLDMTCAEARRHVRASALSSESFPLGDANSLIELAREYGRSDDPVIRDRITRLYSRSEVARLTTMRAKAAVEAGKVPGPESSLGYINGVHLARATRDLALDIVGAGGMLSGDSAPRGGAITAMALGSLVHGIQGGAEQIQRNIVGERVLGLPKEPSVDRDIAFKDVRQSRLS